MHRPAPLLVYLVTEDWFFRSHFLPMARAARGAGFRVAVAGRLGPAAQALREEGFETLALDMGRGGLHPLGVLAAAGRVAALLRARRPAIVHMIALRPILIGLVAGLAGPPARQVVALTGLGFLGAGGGRRAALVRSGLFRVVGRLARRRRCSFLFENPEDRAALEAFSGPLPEERVALLPGAGVDPERFAPSQEPPAPIRAALVARMVWSKGIDIAVDAQRMLRARGIELELLLAGGPDPENPASLRDAALRVWSEEPGVTWAGRVEDVPALWRSAHIALLPSRGGEGLPKSLIEAAACGRPIVTTDVPGCRRLVRHEVEGLLVPPEDAAALAEALARLAADGTLRARLGAAARARALAEFTEAHVAAAVLALYRAALERPV